MKLVKQTEQIQNLTGKFDNQNNILKCVYSGEGEGIQQCMVAKKGRSLKTNETRRTQRTQKQGTISRTQEDKNPQVKEPMNNGMECKKIAATSSRMAGRP